MATASLSAASRADTGKGVARTLRRDGNVPGVIYGHKRDPQPVSVSARELGRLLDHINAETTVIELAIDGKASRTLIREIQRHPIQRNVLHIDFQELVAGEKVIVNVPIVLVGTPVGVRLSAGIMSQTLNELSCRCDPADIPNRVDVDVTDVAVGHSLHVSDLTIPAGVEVLTSPEETVMIIAAPKEEKAAVVEEPTSAEPEVIRKAKADEEADEKK
jgi:large subunit ribosomal protein L25